MIGPHERRQPPRDRLEQPLLGPRQQERLLARGVDAGRRVGGGSRRARGCRAGFRHGGAGSGRARVLAWGAPSWGGFRAVWHAASIGVRLLIDHRSIRPYPLVDRRLPSDFVSARTFRLPVDQRRKRLPSRAFTRASGAVPRSPPDGNGLPDVRQDRMRTERTSATAGSTCAGTRPACSRSPPALAWRPRPPRPARPRHDRAADADPDGAGAARPARPRRAPGDGPPRHARRRHVRPAPGLRPQPDQARRLLHPARQRTPGRRGSRSRRRRSTCSRSAPRATPTSRTSSSRSRRRAPRARVPAGTTFRLEAVSRATGAVVGERAGRDRDPALPRARSSRRSRRSAAGRRRVRFTATAATTGNAPLEIELGARDREETFDLSFSPPPLHLEPEPRRRMPS